MAKRKPKFYTESDVESLANIMQELPDLTPTRLLKNDVLAKVSKVILSLSKDKAPFPLETQQNRGGLC
ncbi:hypothetical protein ACZ87_03088, partial [Candidatus Erwinia dacicola]